MDGPALFMAMLFGACVLVAILGALFGGGAETTTSEGPTQEERALLAKLRESERRRILERGSA